ncbi:hypothetical protein [Actinoalloteichus hymeniacidonis]|uniref:Uncharacterized protein n=1 Tax=Actinoalloteichus hymeniacidonis TaxID=340345 RepID=A0AAC9HLP8_9PSEU|nr:hypothetical protein [Actinoalloteichus hymeniacidonis]AOS61495.1 hypothetical protein TL08_03315 [Actinoalloteichus hymeniacidonis]MBB5910497.1 CHASE2 domain-containing sensor protein [Actinoalloteichus hymeniacidonis]
MVLLQLPITARGIAILTANVIGLALVVWAIWLTLGPGIAVLLAVLLVAQVTALAAAFRRTKDE